MNGNYIAAIRENVDGLTQAEMARALEVSPVTLNRWENDDPRYRIPAAQRRLLEALDQFARSLTGQEKHELLDLLRAAPVAGIIAKAAMAHLLPSETVTRLAATPGLGWFAMIADVGVGASLPFFPRLQSLTATNERASPNPTRRPKPSSAQAEDQSLYTLGVDAL